MSKIGKMKAIHNCSIIASINKLEEETELTKNEYSELGPLKKSLYRSQARGENAAAAIDEWRKSRIERTGNDPDTAWQAHVTSMLVRALADILEGKDPPKWLTDAANTPLPGGKDSPVMIPDYGVKWLYLRYESLFYCFYCPCGYCSPWRLAALAYF